VAGASVVVIHPPSKMNTELVTEQPAPSLVTGNSADGRQGITPAIVAVIDAAAEAFVGKRVRILSIRMIGDAAAADNTWASQGRDMIQTSHNLVQRGH
jgi:hypothetical protein